jgi:hypothetical protein
MNKQQWLAISEVLDSFRIVPRLLVFITLFAYIFLSYEMILWAMQIYGDLKDIPVSIAGLIGGLLTTLAAIPTMVIRKYFDGGRNWDKSDKKD